MIAAVAIAIAGVGGMIVAAWPGIVLGCDLMPDPNYSHTLYGASLARGGQYANAFYPGVLHFVTYALFLRTFGNTDERFSFAEFENSVYLCRVASLTINLGIYLAACACLHWLCRQYHADDRRGLSLWVLAGFSVLWVIAFPINYFSYLLRPDNGLLLGLMPAIVAVVTLWQSLATTNNRRLIFSGIWLGTATALFVISKNQGQPLMLATVLFGLGAVTSLRSLRAFGIWSVVGCVSHFVLTTLVWLSLRLATNTGELGWAVICDPTYVLRNHRHLASVNSVHFLHAEIWSLACAAPAVALVVTLLACRIVRLLRSPARDHRLAREVVALSAAALLLATLPIYFGLRELAVYNLVVPVGVAIFLAAAIFVIFRPRISAAERRFVGIATVLALPVAFYSNSTLRSAAIDNHRIITTARGSLDRACYVGEDHWFCDLPEMRLSLLMHYPDTQWQYYVKVVSDYAYYKSVCDDLKQDPAFIAASKGNWDYRDLQVSTTLRILRLLRIVSDPRPTPVRHSL